MTSFPEKFSVYKEATLDKPWIELICEEQDSIDDLMRFVNLIDNTSKLNEFEQPYYFRGQVNSFWTLKPRITRLLEGMESEQQALIYEYEAMTYFRERAHMYMPTHSLQLEDPPECFCLMQHYSAPTRLLDWTTSFFVALYFSVFDITTTPTESPKETEGAVWFFPTQPLWVAMEEIKEKIKSERDWKQILSSCGQFVDFGINRALPTIINTYKSDWKSERISIQKGIFTFCEKLFCDQANAIGDTLMNKYQDDETKRLFKLIITPKQKRDFRANLNKFNISAATLFPGIDGLGKSITEIIRVQREMFGV